MSAQTLTMSKKKTICSEILSHHRELTILILKKLEVKVGTYHMVPAMTSAGYPLQNKIRDKKHLFYLRI